jgi:ubiquinone/menaquinone biosynthesis C-methylase UbiE
VTVAAEQVKACCASVYGSAAARYLLGERLHPGGAELTSRLIGALEAHRGQTLADIACGPGASALQLARETGCEVIGIDLSPQNVADASRSAAEAGLTHRVSFIRGDAESLPLADASIDGALCECALCTFPEKAAAAAELARVLRPGARLALSDVTVAGELPPELRTLAAWVACIAEARSLAQIEALLEDAGLSVRLTETHDGALVDLLERVEVRIRAARVLAPTAVGAENVERGLELLSAAREAVKDEKIGYGVVVAKRSHERSHASER